MGDASSGRGWAGHVWSDSGPPGAGSARSVRPRWWAGALCPVSQEGLQYHPGLVQDLLLYWNLHGERAMQSRSTKLHPRRVPGYGAQGDAQERLALVRRLALHRQVLFGGEAWLSQGLHRAFAVKVRIR